MGLLTGRSALPEPARGLLLLVCSCCSCMQCLRSRLPLPLSQMRQGIDNVRPRLTSGDNTITS